MAALSVFDGSEEWRWTGDAPAIGASPIISVIDEQVQLVFKSEEKIVGLDPRSGKEFWQIPFKVQMDNTIVTPLVIDDQLITSDYRMGLRSWRIFSDGESWEARELWKNDRVCMFMSSPVFAAGQLVAFSDFRKGELIGLDPGDGSIMWRGEPRSGEYATLISWGEDVMAFLEDGSLVVGKVSRDRFQILQRYRLGGSKMWTHPAISDNRIVIRDGSRLVVFQLAER